jgi:hypothetical protein
MNELDLIRSFRADVPGPSAAATAGADRAWRRTRRRRIARWAPRTAAGAAAVAAVAAAALIVSTGDEGRLGAQSAKAAETLRHAAAEAHGLPRALKPGEYWYVRSTTTWTSSLEAKRGGAYTVMGLEVREEWVAADGTRRWTTRQAGPLRFPSAGDRDRWEADGRPDLLPAPSEDRTHTGFYIGPTKQSYRQLLALPRDPRILYERFHDAAVECRCGNGVDDQTFVVAIEFLRGTPLPTDLRAAILRAMALIPGIEQHAERDVLGRPGVGVAYNGSQGRQTLIFDPSTYDLLGDREGAGGTADLESGIVNSMTDRP